MESKRKHSKSPSRKPPKINQFSLYMLKSMYTRNLIKLPKMEEPPNIKDIQNQIIKALTQKKHIKCPTATVEEKNGVYWLKKNHEVLYALLQFTYTNLTKLQLLNINIKLNIVD
jgi:hypothetical protein